MAFLIDDIFNGAISLISNFFQLFPTWSKLMLAGLLVWKIGKLDVNILGVHYYFDFVDNFLKAIFATTGLGIDSFKIGVGLFCGGIIVLLLNLQNLK